MNKIRVQLKTSAADLMGLVGKKCTLKFDRQDEVFEGVLCYLDNDDAWQCDAIFQAHWIESIEPNDDGTYTICVRIPDDEYEDLLSMDCDEMLTYDEENEGRSPDCEDWR